MCYMKARQTAELDKQSFIVLLCFYLLDQEVEQLPKRSNIELRNRHGTAWRS